MPVFGGRTAGRSWNAFSLVLKAIMAIVMFAMMTITAADVAGRYLFNYPVHGGFEIVQYLMAFIVFASLPLVSATGSHLSVSMFEGRLRGRALRIHRVYTLLFSLAGLVVLAWRMGLQGQLLSQSQQVSGFLAFPLAPIAWALTVFAWLAVAVVVIMLARAFMGLDPRLDDIHASAGTD